MRKTKLLAFSIAFAGISACSAQVSVQPNPNPSSSSANPTASPSNQSPSNPMPTNNPSAQIPQNEIILNWGSQLSLDNLKAQGITVQGVSTTTDRFGRANQALAFSGQDTYMRVPININPNIAPQVTMAVWARSSGENTSRQAIFSHDDGNFDRTFGLDERPGSWGWSAFSGPDDAGVIGGIPVDKGAWTFLAVVYDATTQTMRFYVNDKKTEARATNGMGFDFLILGANPGFSENFIGELDDPIIYKRALSEAEISQLYNTTKQFPLP